MPKVITIPGQEIFVPPDRFLNTPEVTIKIEHSLVAIAKWEAKWHVPFLDPNSEKTNEMMIDYIRCMTISPGKVDDKVYYLLTKDKVNTITEYIQNPMTATWFKEEKNASKSREVITSELIYYWMVALQIPFECQKWHLNRLLTLIRVCNAKNEESMPNKKNKLSKGSETNKEGNENE